MENKIVAVVVTCNRKELLKQCIDGVLKQKNCSCDVIVVDNASADGTQEMIINQYDMPEVIYINTGTNLGGAGGFQFGVKKAVLLGYEYVWIMDDDTLPEEEALYELIEVDKELEGKWGFLSSVAYWTDGSICRMNIQKKTIFRHIGKREYNSRFAPIEMCSFVSLLVKSSVIQEVGLPIGEYFIWTDDYEYTGRISLKWPCYMVPESKVIHAMKKHTRVNFATDDISRINRYHYIYRNDVHCYRRYGLKGWLYIVLKDCYTIFNILRNAKVGKWSRVKIVLKGFKEGILFKPQIEMLD
ncbi:MAG: glycosyltransferase family 2 protein [Ruminococcus flavefaciens]|nr:glycosyltransferase family 2 protein [Roseburia sp.]MCM1234948.1 glycosyltransferase family 2 protein [Ruminococcus flavefaciens]